MNYKKYVPKENGDTHPNLKDSECANPINAQLDDGIGLELVLLCENDKGTHIIEGLEIFASFHLFNMLIVELLCLFGFIIFVFRLLNGTWKN